MRATPHPVTVTQADGTQITFRLRGDERFHYKTTVDGYALVPDSRNILTYAHQDEKGNLVSTNIKARNVGNRNAAERKLLNTLPKNQTLRRVSQSQRIMRSPSNTVSTQTEAFQKTFPVTGSPRSLVILVNFSDKSFVTPTPKTAFNDLLNQKGYSANGGTGSARDYFRDNSMGVFDPQFDVAGPFNLPQKMDFYGKNDSSGDDVNPQQMVIDACTLAAANGVDFSVYDTDKNGIVDNVFIYYAGYNEAEGAAANTVWPHRWSLNNTNTKFNSVAVYGYACTSELRDASGTNMCGIGTFTHEFGHVLGLPDLYNTDNQDKFTLSFWDIMDAGPYLNAGRTPPCYSGYERFFLGWLAPTELKEKGDFSLNALSTANMAYLISQTGNHNLNGASPSSAEFFLLENRQKSGWDTYLPGHGMLVSHINYNASTWADNTVNNNADALGVGLVTADGVASDYNLPGDPFPGTSKNAYFMPVLLDGTAIKRMAYTIKETSGLITFHWDSVKVNVVPPVANIANDTTYTSFNATWKPVNFATGYYLTVYNISEGQSSLIEEFNNRLNPPPGWIILASNSTDSNVYSGTAPAILFENNNEYIETETYMLPVANLSFFIRSVSDNSGGVLAQGLNGGFLVQGLNAQNLWEKVDSIKITSALNIKDKSYKLDESKGYKRFRFTFKKSLTLNDYSVAFDDVKVDFNKNLNYVLRESWTEDSSQTIKDLTPNTEYFYKVRSSEKNPYYENISDFSNLISAKTLGNVVTFENKDKSQLVYKTKEGTIIVKVPARSASVTVFNAIGQQIIAPITPTSDVIEINNLVAGHIYIIRVGENAVKIIL
ncbi:MAG: M6 family metalloprotease domain-containing protein [Paludibacter sp.]